MSGAGPGEAPGGSALREAARALLATRSAQSSGAALVGDWALDNLAAALDAPPPSRDELRAKLEALWLEAARTVGYPYAMAERDRLIAELLVLLLR